MNLTLDARCSSFSSLYSLSATPKLSASDLIGTADIFFTGLVLAIDRFVSLCLWFDDCFWLGKVPSTLSTVLIGFALSLGLVSTQFVFVDGKLVRLLDAGHITIGNFCVLSSFFVDAGGDCTGCMLGGEVAKLIDTDDGAGGVVWLLRPRGT